MYYNEKISLPAWYVWFTSGSTASSFRMNIKKSNGLFGVLENNQVNTEKDSLKLMEADNSGIRVCQMTAIIPQLVNLDDSSSDFDSIFKACLNESGKTTETAATRTSWERPEMPTSFTRTKG